MEANDDGHIDVAHVAVGVHDALRYAVAADDAAKNVHQNRLHGWILEDDAECFLHTRRIGRSSHVEEVGGVTATQLDDVHGRHGQARAVDHAAHVAIQFDVVEARLIRFYFGGVLFGGVAHGRIIRVAVEGVAVQRHL